MKKILMGLMMGAMCIFVSAQQPTTTKIDKEETKTTKAIGKKQKTNSFNTPGYTGIPKPHAPRKHSNPMPKLEKRPEGTNPNLLPR
ncbi:MAG TPA: hypothetical protein VK154_06335 [Chitinophagales bacterium]|nr:hypothetical protein [Chitinophagales bacterium]